MVEDCNSSRVVTLASMWRTSFTSSHFLPPPWEKHLPVAPRANFTQPGASHFFPPPCAMQRPEVCADFSQLGSSHSLPPPCVKHLPREPRAICAKHKREKIPC